MAGFENQVLLCDNVNFNTGLPAPHPGLITQSGQLIIGSTSLNAGGTHLNIGELTSVGGTIQISYDSPNINLETTPAGSSVVKVVRQVFTSSGTYTPTANMSYCDIEVVGGGGGGGGAFTGAFQNAAGGGAGGGYARGIFTSTAIGASKAITVGAGGTAGPNTGASPGGTGGTTSVGSLISATGGAGGAGANIGGIFAGSGTPGIGTGGDFRTEGAPGYSGDIFVGGLSVSGEGGSSFFGGGGVGAAAGATTSIIGNNGNSAGGGASGAAVNLAGSSQVGGTGAPGIVIVTEYISFASGGSQADLSLTGNDAVLVVPDAQGNINLLTANATVQFTGTTNTETLDFGIMSNLILGSSATSITSALHCVGFGQLALNSLTTATGNCAGGYQSQMLATSGIRNSSWGTQTLTALTTAFDCTAFGANSVQSNVSSDGITGIGSFALNLCTARLNTAVGRSILENLTSGESNTGIGSGIGINLLTGQFNFFGGANTASAYTSSESSNLLIMNPGVVGESNAIRIGNQGTGNGQQNKVFMAGIANSVVSGSPVFVTSSGQLGIAGLSNSVIMYSDDFISDISGNVISGKLPWVQSGNLYTYGTGNSQHPGVIQNLAISTTGVREIGLGSVTNVTASFYLGASSFSVNWIFNIATLSNSTNRYNLNFGMGDTITAAAQANGVWFGYSDNVNSGNWTFNTSSASTATNSNSSVTVTTGWHNAQIFINSTGTSVSYVMDGVTLGTITTNIPSTAISALHVLQWVSGTIAAATISIDFFEMIQTLTTPR